MVFLTPNPSRVLAACCNVEVINGAVGLLFVGFSSIFCIWYWLSFNSFKAISIAIRSFGSNVSPAKWVTCIVRVWLDWVFTSAKRSQYSCGIKAWISRSRSTNNLTATDWTRPADKPRATFFHNNGDSINPTTRSIKRRACWALTRLISKNPGFLKAFWIAVLVISLNTTRRYLSSSPPITSFKCQAMASPSLSKSVAR